MLTTSRHHFFRQLSPNSKWGRTTDRIGSRGAPAKQKAWSALTPCFRSIFKALQKLSWPPCNISRTTTRGLLNRLNLCCISPSFVKKLWGRPMWIIPYKSLRYSRVLQTYFHVSFKTSSNMIWEVNKRTLLSVPEHPFGQWSVAWRLHHRP